MHERSNEEEESEGRNLSVHRSRRRPEEEDYAEEEEKGGLMGFFKKTFSSVKKTFESTFYQRSEQQHPRLQGRPRSKMAGRRTSLLEDDYPNSRIIEESP